MSPMYSYQGLSQSGKETKGEIDAENSRSARDKLRANGIFPSKIEEISKKKKTDDVKLTFRSEKASTMQLAVMTRQLATLLGSGMPLVDSLRALADQVDSPSLRQTITTVRERVTEGISLHLAMEPFPKVFPKVYVKMIKSGESSGTLDLVLERLSETLESQAALNRKIISAITYPVLMIFLCFAVIGLLLGFVVPQISKIFADKGDSLPLATQIVVDLSNFVQSYWWIVILLLVAISVLFRRFIQTKDGRYKFDRLIIRSPFVGPIALKLATARFSTNLGTMLQSGVELLTALTISNDIISNSYLEEAILKAREGVSEGKSLSQLLSQSNRFPKMLIHLMAVGEQSGELDRMLLRVGKSFELEVESIISALTSILEPVLIIFLAVIVGGILFAVMSPMLEMSSLAR
ncbi:MAG TPA: type II secretion system inner membrane protein GspF [Oligoflexia bacterium]|nr:type II secretion system inner membrane protein GspF [Oligoflexia bacterium]HMP47930.1 type II secretion system inner membrane protein GspF [Oligoflexia bacterium]